MLNDRVVKLRNSSAQAFVGNKVKRTIPYVVPFVAGSVPFFLKYLDPLSFGAANLFLNKEQ